MPHSQYIPAQPGTTAYLVEGDADRCETCVPVAGLEQGSSIASPLFGIAVGEPLALIEAEPEVAEWDGVYQDDIFPQAHIPNECSL